MSSRCAGLELDLGSRERAIVERWSRMGEHPRFRQETERSTQAQFLVEILGTLLGYTLPAGNLDAHHIRMETASREVKGGKTPDACLGFYGNDRDVTRAIIELKGPGADLDARQSGYGNITPVDQAFGYLGRFDDCRWAIVSNFLEIRLYSKKRGQGYAHEFRLDELADRDALRRFLFLLHRDRLLAEPPCNSIVDQLLAETRNEEQAITRRFYDFYRDLRLRFFQELVQANSAPPGDDQAAHEVWLLTATQKILDRVLFVCFCEDTGLLPHNIVHKAFEATRSGFVDTTRWQQLCGLFRAVDKGHPPMHIPGYNGGLFRHDPLLDALTVPDEALADCLRLSDYDFQTDVNVNILGHVFEQSISDLEAVRAGIRGEAVDKRQSKRKQEGVFYTPETITRYIVAHTIGSWLEERFAALEGRHAPDAIPDTHHVKKLAAQLALWEDYQKVLAAIKILDPACGSGAFLVAAFDYLHAEYTRVNRRLTELRGGQPELFDLDKLILQQNLYGVDLNSESVEITKLSLWLKTARTDRPLNDLDGKIKCGNSLVALHPDLPPELAQRAFDWQSEFPEVFASGGFNCVIGNPPYIRQEWLAPYKTGFQREFECYSGTADAYLYFFERGLQVLERGGRLGMISSGTFASANFAKAFRQWLPTVGRFTHFVDFGNNRPFEDADVISPTISIIRKDPTPRPFRYYFMRGKIPDSIPDAVAEDGIDCDDTVFGQAEWRFQPTPVTALFNRLMGVGRPLGEIVQGRMYRGVLTGLNDAFIVDQATRDRLVRENPACESILKKLLRGQDLRPWYYRDEGQWMIAMPCGWTGAQTDAESETDAWHWLAQTHPSIAVHLDPFAERGRKRSDKGKFWWELRSCDYYPAFDKPKILWPDIAKLPRFAWDEAGAFSNNTTYMMPSHPSCLAILQSRIMWFCISQVATPLGARAGLWRFRFFNQFVSRLPIPSTSEPDKQALSDLAMQATAVARERYALHERVRHRIHTDLDDGTHKLNQKLAAWWDLDFRGFRGEVKKAFKTDIPLKERGDWEGSLAGWQTEHHSLTARLVDLETAVNDRVNHLFALTPGECRTLDDHMQHAMIDYPLGSI